MLNGKKILLGITGGIAAYKAAELTRRLVEQGAQVQVVMTESAQQFINPLTFVALSGRPVRTEMFDQHAEAGMGHIELARWADAIVIAPASANVIARLAQGCADDLLTTLCLASTAPLFIAPAMNQQMWQHPAVQANLALLNQRGITMIGPNSGVQACGETGWGRMSEPQEILASLLTFFQPHPILQGLTILVTAGATREAIDPVRYISNKSSGKMGYALAIAAQQAGARVVLISGPSVLPAPAQVQLIKVESTQEMLNAVREHLSDCDVFIGAAAVADYACSHVSPHKIKKHADIIMLELHRNPDIIKEVAQAASRPFTIGFAAETENVVEYAEAKLHQKNLDMVIANLVNQAETGFDCDTNACTILSKHKEPYSFELASKTQLAKQLIAYIGAYLQEYPNEKN